MSSRGVLARHLAAAAVATLAAASVALPARAALIPGGGPQGSDCYVELDVWGIEDPGVQVKRNRTVLCTDGDPCDTDRECGNDSCRFDLAVCVNQTDPHLPACAPAGRLRSLKGGNTRLHPADHLLQPTFPVTRSGAACGNSTGLRVRVRVRRNGRKLPGRRALPAISAVAERGTTPALDVDRFVLQCLPRTTPCAE